MNPDERTPWFSGAQTFLKAPLMGFDQIEPGMVVIGGAPHDTTHTSRFGTRMGPRGIREGSLAFASKLRNASATGVIDVNTGMRLSPSAHASLADVGDFNVYPSDVLKSSEGIAGGGRGSREERRVLRVSRRRPLH